MPPTRIAAPCACCGREGLRLSTGLCRACYTRKRRRGTTDRVVQPSFEERFWTKVAKVDGDGCWEWLGSRVGSGKPEARYGQFASGDTQLKAHRVAWELTNGPIPEGMLACHRCDNPGCVRPSHLFLGTPKDNSVDMVEKGRGWKHDGALCPRAKLTPEQVAEIRSKYVHGQYGYKRLGAEYGMDPGTIERIIKRETWREYA